MATYQIAFTAEQISYIKTVLQKNEAILIDISLTLAGDDIDTATIPMLEEIQNSINILETEGQYV